MSKPYSIEEIQRALEFWEATKHCKSVWDGFQHMMRFAAGIHEVDMDKVREGETPPSKERLQALKAEISGSTKRMYRKVAAMERLQELAQRGYAIQVYPKYDKSEQDWHVAIAKKGELFEFPGIEGKTLPEAILNLKVE